MIMLMLISNAVGIVLREWKMCRPITHKIVRAALVILLAAVVLLTYGNYLGNLGPN